MSTSHCTIGQTAPSADRDEDRVDKVTHVAERPYTVALFVLGGIGNLGNDASLEAMVATVKRVRPDARVVCICGEPEIISGAFKLSAVPIYFPAPEGVAYKIANWLMLRQLGHMRAWYRIMKFVRGVDAIVMPGTGILDDFGLSSPFGFPYRLFMWSASARFLGVPVAFVSVGAGPIVQRGNRFFMMWAARLARYRSYRDEVSSKFMQRQWTGSRADPIYPDLVFGLPLEDADAAGAPSDRPKTIGVGILNYYGWECSEALGVDIHHRYVRSIARLIARFGSSGHRVRLLVGIEDEPFIGELEEALGLLDVEPGAPWIEKRIATSLSEHATHISGADIVVGTRYHTVIASLMLCRPTIALGYADKFDAVMADFGMQDYCTKAETFEVEHVMELVNQLAHEFDTVRSNLAERLSSSRSRLAEQEERLADRVLNERT